MKKWLYILFILFIPKTVIGQIERIHIQLTYDNSLSEMTLFVPEQDQEFLKHDPKCSMDHGLRLKDSLPDGEYYVYFNDTLRYQAFYQDNVKNGEWIHYKKDGEIWYKEEYIDGQLKHD